MEGSHGKHSCFAIRLASQSYLGGAWVVGLHKVVWATTGSLGPMGGQGPRHVKGCGDSQWCVVALSWGGGGYCVTKMGPLQGGGVFWGCVKGWSGKC